MAANPQVELTAWKPGSGWIIMRGAANLADTASPEVRSAGFQHMVGLGECYSGPDDPALTFFTLDNPQAWLCDIDGSWQPLAL